MTESETREMLTFAAKAAGWRITGWNKQHDVAVAVLEDGSFWQPLLKNWLTDCMGDALRLAIKLHLCIDLVTGSDCIQYFNAGKLCLEEIDITSDNPDAATRLAITRAAAAIGREMP